MAKQPDITERIALFSSLGTALINFCEAYDPAQSFHQKLQKAIQRTCGENPWFTKENYQSAIYLLAKQLNKEKLTQWLHPYTLPAYPKKALTAGVVMAGNIPLVGFHDFLCVLICGHHFTGKLSHKDPLVLPLLAEQLSAAHPHFKEAIHFCDKINKVDFAISTGSNNSARYFEYQFAQLPHIIRKNRNSVAVLTPNYSTEDLQLLSDDLFSYFGLGCRNVSKLYLPKSCSIEDILEQLPKHTKLLKNKGYANNYRYNKALFNLNKQPYTDAKAALFCPSSELNSPISVYHYEHYSDIRSVWEHLNKKTEEIQCIVTNSEQAPINTITPGQSQSPCLWDYADNIDTIAFIKQLES